MKQFLKQAYHGKEIMETGDHSTNGASPKSLMSRRNFLMPDTGDKIMKRTIKVLSMTLIVAITMLSLSGCSKDDDDNGLVNTKWKTATENVAYLYFVNESQAKIGVDINFAEGTYQNCTYHYSNGEGSITQGSGTTTFSVNGKKLTLNFLDGTSIVFTKI
jgi:hypothetical protein